MLLIIMSIEDEIFQEFFRELKEENQVPKGILNDLITFRKSKTKFDQKLIERIIRKEIENVDKN